MKQGSTVISLLALLCAVVSLVLSIRVHVRQPPDEEAVARDVYGRVVTEVSVELMPFYANFGLEPPERADSIGDLIRPLLSVSESRPQTGEAGLPAADGR